jgi:hypothetical protein
MAAERQFAVEAVRVYGLPLDINPVDALHAELARCNGHVAWLGELIAAFESRDELKQRSYGDGFAFERPSVWLELYDQERKHLVKVAETCARLNIDTRRVMLAERQGEQIAGVIRGVLFDLGVDAADDLPAIVRKHLMLVNGAGDPSSN